MYLLKYIATCCGAYTQPGAYDHRSACAVCSLQLVNFFLNVLYHANTDTAEPFESLMSTSRPQEGYVFPLMSPKRAASHQLDESVAVRFSRAEIKDQVSCVYTGLISCIHIIHCVYTSFIVYTQKVREHTRPSRGVYTRSICVYTKWQLCIHETHLCIHETCLVYTFAVVCIHRWQAAVTGRWLKLLFDYAWGEPYMSGTRLVYARILPCGLKQEIASDDVTSHIVKHGAASNAGSSSIPSSVLIQVKASTRTRRHIRRDCVYTCMADESPQEHGGAHYVSDAHAAGPPPVPPSAKPPPSPAPGEQVHLYGGRLGEARLHGGARATHTGGREREHGGADRKRGFIDGDGTSWRAASDGEHCAPEHAACSERFDCAERGAEPHPRACAPASSRRPR